VLDGCQHKLINAKWAAGGANTALRDINDLRHY